MAVLAVLQPPQPTPANGRGLRFFVFAMLLMIAAFGALRLYTLCLIITPLPCRLGVATR